MKPSKLLRHIETKDTALKSFGEQKQLLKAITSSNMPALRALLFVANRIAESKKTFTVGEELTLPAAKDICRGALGEAAVKKVAEDLLTASSINRRMMK